MSDKIFKAMVVSEGPGNTFTRHISRRSTKDLPAGDILIRVYYSALNYKDGLSASGNRGVTRRYPHTPGVDAAGVVEESTTQVFSPGDEVFVTGFDLGMNTSGGFGQYIRVPSSWVVKCPNDLSLRESMIYGTAGLTAGLSIFKFEQHGVKAGEGQVLVTGATGGVGSMAVAMLAKSGYEVVASTGKGEAKEFLFNLGAKEIISRDELIDSAGKALLKERWRGVVDTVGGDILATAIKSTSYCGVVTCCGNVASPQLSTTVFPFILRGVSLIGIDSVECSMELRLQIWRKIAREWKVSNLASMVTEINLDELDEHIDRILQGKETGRILIRLQS